MATAIEPLELHIPHQLGAYLDALVQTGLYGHTRADCAERLLADAIEHRMHGPIANALRDAQERR